MATKDAIDTFLRNYINASGSAYVVAEFIKKDGTQRTLRFAPANMDSYVSVAKTERARKAAEKRRHDNPHLMCVWDEQASAPRSLNLRTVYRIISKPERDGELVDILCCRDESSDTLVIVSKHRR